ncbi:MAG: hypothetical protein PHU06_00675 [Gallionella sp.]|nr:hypothetical protein [Gallionella sp.]MDD4957742.1 hypothetical protein [Gallionella sp.]
MNTLKHIGQLLLIVIGAQILTLAIMGVTGLQYRDASLLMIAGLFLAAFGFLAWVQVRIKRASAFNQMTKQSFAAIENQIIELRAQVEQIEDPQEKAEAMKTVHQLEQLISKRHQL